MSGFLTSVLAFLLAICVLVAVHEWGHYAAARALGVKVLRFSVGFGRPLWLRRWGPDGTEYCLSAIPVGGYVRLLDERDSDVSDDERHRAFNRQPIPARIIILFAGPALNFIFAIVAYWCMFVVGVPGLKPVIGEVEADSIAAEAGLTADARIVAVAGKPVATWEGAILGMLDDLLTNGDIRLDVIDAADQPQQIQLATAGREAELTEPGELFSSIGIRPWSPRLPPVLDELTPGGAAELAGLQSGDRIVSVSGVAFSEWSEWVEFVRARPGEAIDVEILRGEARLQLPMQIGVVESDEGRIGRIGASVAVPEDLYETMQANQRYGLAGALDSALSKTWDMSVLTVRMVVRMITGQVSVKNISGPINIAQFAGYSASGGMASFLGFLAIVSISLGILNLLPVPMLDGGQIVYQLVEAIKGSPMSERAQMIGQQLGIVLLLMLMSFAFYNDLSRLLG